MKRGKNQIKIAIIAIFVITTSLMPLVNGAVLYKKSEMNTPKYPDMPYSSLFLDPVVVFSSISNVDPWGGEATFKAVLMSKGFTDCCDIFFVWDTQWHFYWYDYAHQTPAENYCGFCPHIFSYTEDIFQRGINYSVRAVAQNPGESDQTLAHSFTPGKPKVETHSATNIDYDSATLPGVLTDNGEAATQVRFYYDTEHHSSISEYQFSTPIQTLSSPSAFDKDISGLEIGQKYYYRTYAINDASWSTGGEKTFETWGAHFEWSDADSGGIGALINFNASSSCGDDSITNYEWDFENDGVFDYSDTTPYASYDYDDNNPHDCLLKITNNYGQVNTENQTVQAIIDGGNTPPSRPGKPNGPSSGEIAIEYSYQALTTDPENDNIRYGWDWDDGNPIEWSEYLTSGTVCEKSHIWASPGDYSVRVKAEDVNGAQSSFSTSLTVTISDPVDENQPPNTPSTPSGESSGEINIDYSYTTSTTDPDEDSIQYGWDWDDGGPVEWTGFHDSGDEITNSYSWNSPGEYYIKVKAKDSNGAASSFSSTLKVTITDPGGDENHKPILSESDTYSEGVKPKNANTGDTLSFSAHYYDEDEDNPTKKDLSIIKPSGGENTYTMSGSGSDNDFTYTKSFSEPGTYDYYFYFEDGNGGSARLPQSGTWKFTIEEQSNQIYAPNWPKDKSWTYKVDKLECALGEGSMDASINSLTFEVVEANDDGYKLEFGGEVTGTIDSEMGLDVSFFDLDDTYLEGEMHLTKNLAIKKIKTSINGDMVGRVAGIVWVMFEVTTTSIPYYSSNGEYDFIQFPFEDGDTWNVDYEELETEIYTKVSKRKLIGWNTTEKTETWWLDFNEHEISCDKQSNGEYKLTSEFGVSYKYNPEIELFTQSSGKIYFGYDNEISIDYSMILKECPPTKPTSPTGDLRAKAGKTCQYTTRSTDPNNDVIQYGWDWNGDKIVDEWTSFYDSGDFCTITHTWTKEEIDEGQKCIYVKAKDINSEESLWSDPANLKGKTLFISKFSGFFEKIIQQYPVVLKILELLKR